MRKVVTIQAVFGASHRKPQGFISFTYSTYLRFTVQSLACMKWMHYPFLCEGFNFLWHAASMFKTLDHLVICTWVYFTLNSSTLDLSTCSVAEQLRWSFSAGSKCRGSRHCHGASRQYFKLWYLYTWAYSFLGQGSLVKALGLTASGCRVSRLL